MKFFFSFRATTPNGENITSRVEATSATEAWAQLHKQGYANVELLDDEYSAIKSGEHDSIQRLEMSAKDEMDLRQQDTLSGRILWSLRQSANLMIWLPLLGWFIYAVINNGWASTEVVISAGLLIVYLAWFVWATIPSVLYWQAQEASAWCRWSEVERWMQWLARWKRWFNIPFPEHELLFRTATAMAGQGRLEEALRMVEKLLDSSEIAPGFYQTRLASLYFATKDFKRAAQLQEQARTLNPSASSTIDLALTLARCMGDWQSAKVLLDDIDMEQLNPLAKLFVYYCRGIIAHEEKDYNETCRCLETALMLGKDQFGSPLMKSVIAGALAYYSLGLAGLGRMSDAKRCFDLARPLLVAREETRLLALCNSALSNI